MLTSIGTELHELLRQVGAAELGALDKIRNNWELLVGPSLAAKAQAYKLKNNLLTVIIKDAGYRSELQRLKPNLLAMIKALLRSEKLVKRIQFTVGNFEYFVPPPDVKPTAEKKLSSKTKQLIKLAEQVNDPQLRRAWIGIIKNIS